MENEVTPKRGLVVILVAVTIVIFIGFVWLIAKFIPWNRLGFQNPSVATGTPVVRNCTYPISYWKEHPELYPAQIVIGKVVYKERELEALLSNNDENPVLQIRAQMAVAFLNISGGADLSVIEATIFNAYGWLNNHPVESQLTGDDLSTGIRYYNVLEAYNLGLAGVEACEETSTLALTGTSTVTEIPTLLITLSPSQTMTSTASETPTLTATYFYVAPSSTAISTTEAPPQIPTNTPIPPTARPTPTKTPIPNTATFTPPPLPTATYTPPPWASPTSSGFNN
jgi:hypothetical protein